MAMNDALSGGQSYSGTFKLFRQMQTLKDAEQLVDILHVKARAVVLHAHLEFFFIAAAPADLDFGGASHAREFDRIGNKVDNDQPQHGTVSVARWKRTDPPDNVPALGVLPDFGDDVLDELIQVHLSFIGLGPPDPGKRQQVVDKVAHSFCRVENCPYEPLTLLVERRLRLPL